MENYLFPKSYRMYESYSVVSKNQFDRFCTSTALSRPLYLVVVLYTTTHDPAVALFQQGGALSILAVGAFCLNYFLIHSRSLYPTIFQLHFNDCFIILINK